MFNYIFQLGREKQISIAEIEAIFLRENIKIKSQKQLNQFLIVNTDKSFDAKELIGMLGGVIKIGTELELDEDIVKTISDSLDEDKTGKVHFSVSGDNAKQTALAVKKELKSRNRSVRYIEANNTATIIHNHLVKRKSDFTIIDRKVFVTAGVQDIESFSKRDYDRPGSDTVSGMLPPKLARIMINLSQIERDKKLLDPFCGSGTVLLEAWHMGFTNLVGTDLSKKAITDTKKNIDWFIKNHNVVDCSYHLNTVDATELSQHIKHGSIDAIISEPYMGAPLRGKESKERLQTQARELSELYTESFKNFHKILKKDGVAIFIIPQFRHKDNWVKIDCVDQIKKIGFELEPFGEEENLLYWRKKQYVGRGIYKLRKK